VARKSRVTAAKPASLNGFASVESYHAAVLELNRQQTAAVALVSFAQALAGTVMQSRHKEPEGPPAPRRRAPVAKRPPAERPRPDHRSEVTWDEAMSVPWITPDYGASYGAIMVEQPAEKLDPENCFAPWPDSVVPSYAPKPEEEE
jgi:hypothetical protein